MTRTNSILLASGMILLLSFLPAYAVDLNAELSSKGISEKPTFRFVDTAFVDYHSGGKLKDQLYHKNMTISFQVNSSNPSVRDMINRINTYLLQDLNDHARVTELSISYTASIVGGDNSATVDYSLTMMPTIDNYVVAKKSDGSTVIDAGWMGLSLHGPVVIKTEKYGDVEINQPASFLNKVVPNLEIMDPKAQQVLSFDLIDSSSIVAQQPASNWQHMFDPSYIITETSGWGYNGSKIPITTYALGESRIGIAQNSITHSADFTLDKSYEIQTIQHASSATIQIDGHASLDAIGNGMTFTTIPSVNIPAPSNGLSVQTIYAMAGFGIVLAIGVFIWSNKKAKQIVAPIETGPIKYEPRQHWADRFENNILPDDQRMRKTPV